MNIPGYYYDPEKKRYFKVENSKTAPTNSAWSSNNVKRRKLRDEDAATALRHLNLAKSRIRRARVLHEPLTGGFFAREYGAIKDDMQAACFVDGLRNKGCIPIGQGMQVKRMCVAGSDHKTGMCTVYAATVNGDILLSTYLPRDKNKRLNQHLLANYRLTRHRLPPYVEAPIPHISDIQYDAHSNAILVASRQSFVGNNPNSLWLLSPKIDRVDGDPLRPSWLLPSENAIPIPIDGISRRDEAHCIAPAPESSPLRCLVGTSRGIVQCHHTSGDPSWLMPPGPISSNPKLQSQLDLFRDVFTIDFHPSQTEVLRFGGRPGALFTADIRVRHTSWSHLKLPSTITHLRCLDGGNQVLVAGLQNQLGVYDLRFVRSFRSADDDGGRVHADTRDGERRSTYHNNRSHNSQRDDFKGRNRSKRDKRGGKNTEKGGNDHHLNNTVAQPVIKFEHYRNTAHIDIGFAYDPDTGVVAAAHDDTPGTVALYSVRTGSRLRVLDFAKEARRPNRQSKQPQPILDAEQDRDRIDLPMIQSLQFHTFPGDHTPTLFVGGGGDRRGGITAFSFGVDDLEDEA
ncbi:hypothetical protein F4782DRAFT_506067 [Xylaria castorea]|nr:hypothetical protein F4782DRAFT_506067 [Xylaria castorea]